MKTFQIIALVVCLALVAVLLYLFIKAELYSKKLSSVVTGYGLNGSVFPINVSCPNNQKITVTSANVICTSANSIENSSCDPFWQSSGQYSQLFNPQNTLNVTSTLAQQCNGLVSCSVTLPQNVSQNICGQSGSYTNDGKACTGTIQLIGNYTCS